MLSQANYMIIGRPLQYRWICVRPEFVAENPAESKEYEVTTNSYGIEDFRCIVAGAANLASGGGARWLQECGFSNAVDGLAVYFDSTTGSGTGKMVSIIKVKAAEAFYSAQGVVSSFAALLRNIGYAGKLPYPS